MSQEIGNLLRTIEAMDAGGASPQLLSVLQASYDWPLDRDRVLGRLRRAAAAYEGLFAGAAGGPEAAGAVAGPVRLARAPGRINLIGEHTDYNGLPVLPMAINRDILAVFAPRADGSVSIASTDPGSPPRRFELAASIPPYEPGDWGNYCKAAVQGLLDHDRERGRPGRASRSEAPSGGAWRGFQAVFDGDIPPGAGMSSSSALVVLSALLFLRASGREMGRLELADLMARAEHYVGTQGGGMDQAASLLGEAGCALLIHFNPLRVQPVRMPAGYAVIAANSLVRADKSRGAMDRYNRRAIECRLAAALLRETFSRRLARAAPVRLLGDLQPEALGLPAAEIDRIVGETLHDRPYTLREIASLLAAGPEEVAREYCRRRDGSIFPEPPDGFKLKARTRHVLSEGRRVTESAAAFERGDMRAFGELMNRSHESCRDLYEISCPELDRLVEAARGAGALGARLTGAGFGGCTVSLVERRRAEAVIERMVREYYRDYLRRDAAEDSDAIFACQAVRGAGFIVEEGV
jgi:N-acetylgalactosamine kinase